MASRRSGGMGFMGLSSSAAGAAQPIWNHNCSAWTTILTQGGAGNNFLAALQFLSKPYLVLTYILIRDSGDPRLVSRKSLQTIPVHMLLFESNFFELERDSLTGTETLQYHETNSFPNPPHRCHSAWSIH